MAWFGISLLKPEVYAPLKQLQNQSTLLYSRKSDFNFFAQRKDVQKSYQDAINKNYDVQQKEKKALIEKLLKLRDECFDKTAPEYGVIKEDLENLGYHKIKAHNSKSALTKLKNRPKLAPAFTTGMSKPKKPESWHFPTLSFPDVGNILIGAEKLLEAFGALNQSNP